MDKETHFAFYQAKKSAEKGKQGRGKRGLYIERKSLKGANKIEI